MWLLWIRLTKGQMAKSTMCYHNSYTIYWISKLLLGSMLSFIHLFILTPFLFLGLQLWFFRNSYFWLVWVNSKEIKLFWLIYFFYLIMRITKWGVRNVLSSNLYLSPEDWVKGLILQCVSQMSLSTFSSVLVNQGPIPRDHYSPFNGILTR